MKYMMMIYADPAREPVYGTPEFEKMMSGYFALSEKLTADGVMLAGEGLQEAETGKTLRVRGGKVETMDGPVAETKEHLGGFYLIDVPDLETALGYAAQIPSAEYGTVEVRPVMDYPEAS